VAKREVRSQVLSEVEENAARHLDLGAMLLRSAPGTNGPEEVGEVLKAMAGRTHLRYSLLDSRGEVVASSEVERGRLAGMPNQWERPEIREAADSGFGHSIRYGEREHLRFFFAAKRVQDLFGTGPWYLRTARPYSRISSRLAGIAPPFFAIIFGGLGAGVLAALTLSTQLSRGIRRLSGAAESIGREDFGHRIELIPMPEFVPLVRSFNRIAKRTQDYLTTIRDQKEELEAILNGMQEGVLVLGPQGRVRSYNRAVRTIFQLGEDVTGKRPIEFIRSPELQSEVEGLLECGSRETRTLLISVFQERYFHVTVIPAAFRADRGCGTIVVFHEVTELKRLEQVRKDFVANISHELRTPLTSIKGYTETLLSDPQQDPQTLTSFMGVIQRNVNNMTHLLENLLQLARLESSEAERSLGPVDVQTAVSVAWEVCEAMARERSITLRSEMPEEGVLVQSTHEQFVRVLINLFENAVKYSPDGGEIVVSARDRGPEWEIRVQDEGPGISRQDRQRIFERFYRAERDRNGLKISGTGLGLAICKHIVLKHGGRIWVESPVPGKLVGSVFHFSLPKAE
jgi:two-component system phosphate regulon sensor histidine kinase PhoR